MRIKNMRHLVKYIYTGILLIPTTLLIVEPVYGEGHQPSWIGNNGVNRVVETTRANDVNGNAQSYVEVSGTAEIVFDLLKNEDGIVTAETNPNNNKPTFYLGSAGPGAEVDAGIQYEWASLFGVDPGWTAFINVNATTRYNNPYRYVDPTPDDPNNGDESWEALRGHASTYSLHYIIEGNGNILLTVGAAGQNELNVTFYLHTTRQPHGLPGPFNVGDIFPSVGIPLYNPNRLNSMQVKRVIGMTQQGPPTRDGSWLNAIFSRGAVVRLYNGQRHQRDWTPDRVEQTPGTGYDAAGRDGQGNLIVEFPAIESLGRYQHTNTPEKARAVARTNAPASWELRENNQSRYTYETVRINLLDETSIRGEPMQP